MRNIERLSRKDRRRWRISHLFSILFGILVLVAAYLALKIYREPEVIHSKTKTTVASTAVGFRARCDSIMAQAYSNFGFNRQFQFGQTEQARGTGGIYKTFNLGWPEELPFVAFADELHRLAIRDSISCDCQELSRSKGLECFLVSGDAIGAKIVLTADANTNFEGRELALVYENFTTLSVDAITSLLKSGMSFSYIAGPEAAPTSKLRDLVSKNGITVILRLPVSEREWRRISAIIQAGKSTKTDNSLIDKAIDRHPNVKFLCLDFSDGVDSAIAEKILARAKARKIPLLASVDQLPDLAGIADKVGIQIFQAELDSTLRRKPLSQLKNDVMKILISDKSQKWLIAFPDTNALRLENLWQFKTEFERLGVKFRPIIKLVRPYNDFRTAVSRRVDCELAECRLLEVREPLLNECSIFKPRAKSVG